MATVPLSASSKLGMDIMLKPEEVRRAVERASRLREEARQIRERAKEVRSKRVADGASERTLNTARTIKASDAQMTSTARTANDGSRMAEEGLDMKARMSQAKDRQAKRQSKKDRDTH